MRFLFDLLARLLVRLVWWLLGGLGLGGAAAAYAATRGPDLGAVNTLQSDLAADTRILYRVRRHAMTVARAALARLPSGWPAGDFGRLLLAVLERESHGGDTLAPNGTGDHKARRLDRVPTRIRGLVRQVRADTDGTPLVMPADGMGWGRSMWQIDFAAHEFARTGAWRDPDEAADYAAKVLADEVRHWSSRWMGTGYDVATLAAASYNAGHGGVAAALAQGRSPDSATTGGDYAGDVVGNALAWGFGSGRTAA